MDTVHINEQMLTPIETAALLKISRSLAYLLIAQGKIPSIRIGTLIRVPARQLDEAIRAMSAVGGSK